MTLVLLASVKYTQTHTSVIYTVMYITKTNTTQTVVQGECFLSVISEVIYI